MSFEEKCEWYNELHKAHKIVLKMLKSYDGMQTPLAARQHEIDRRVTPYVSC